MQMLFPCVNYIQHAYIERMAILLHSQIGHMAVHTIQNALIILIFVSGSEISWKELRLQHIKYFQEQTVPFVWDLCFEWLIIHGTRAAQEIPVGTTGPIGGCCSVGALPWRFWVLLIWARFDITSIILRHLAFWNSSASYFYNPVRPDTAQSLYYQ